MIAAMWRRTCSDARTAVACGLLLSSVWLSGCALTTPPQRAEVWQRALPETTAIPQGWQQAGSLPGEVGDNWLASFSDPQLQAAADHSATRVDPNDCEVLAPGILLDYLVRNAH